jgi:hypothetical protein
MNTPYVPKFHCDYCGKDKEAIVEGEQGVFIPCQCKESREGRDRDHYLRMEAKKRARRNQR